MNTPDYVQAHKNSIGNRNEILSNERCGCFYCVEIFLPIDVKEWIDEKEGVDQTALCPRCGIDSVIGSESGYPITVEFLRLMNEHWFKAARTKTK